MFFIKEEKRNGKKEKGISLLLVLLIGSLMLFVGITASNYAMNLLRTSQVRGDSVQALYSTEMAFGCAKHWIAWNVRTFTDEEGTNGIPHPTCAGVTYDFSSGSDTYSDGNSPSYSCPGGRCISRFRLPTLRSDAAFGTVDVELDRSNAVRYFDGNIRVYGALGGEGNATFLQRFEEIKYVRLDGADIMFVVDRSGSIGGNRTPGNEDGDWGDLLSSLNDLIHFFDMKIPRPHIGMITFGTDVSDTGVPVTDGLEPEVTLTDSYNSIVPGINRAPASTNLSLGLAIAGAELLDKRYPYYGGGDSRNGEFERIAFSNQNFSSLNSSSGGSHDRNDLLYPDIIIVITDGEPNGIITTQNGAWDSSLVVSGAFVNPQPVQYSRGDTKLFRTTVDAPGIQVVDTGGGTRYRRCHDGGGDPSNILHYLGSTSDTFPNQAMCNATLIARALDYNLNTPGQDKIIIMGVGVGVTNTTADWLETDFVSGTVSGNKLYGNASSTSDVYDAVKGIFESMDFLNLK